MLAAPAMKYGAHAIRLTALVAMCSNKARGATHATATATDMNVDTWADIKRIEAKLLDGTVRLANQITAIAVAALGQSDTHARICALLPTDGTEPVEYYRKQVLSVLEWW